MIESGVLEQRREERYHGWSDGLGRSILGGEATLRSLEAEVANGAIDPRPVSGRQELLENEVNRRIWAADRARAEAVARR
jgi:xylose isomerase